MGDVGEEMGNKMPNRFLGLNIFLPADMAVFALQPGITIEAILFLSLF